MNSTNLILLGILIGILIVKTIHFYNNYQQRKILEKEKLQNELLKLKLLEIRQRAELRTKLDIYFLASILIIATKNKKEKNT